LPYLGGQCISYYPNKKIYGVPGFSDFKSKDFINLLVEQSFSSSDNLIFINEKIIDIKFNSFLFTLNDKYKSKYAIIASGIGNMRPIVTSNISGLDNDFVQHYCMETDLYKGRRVIIAGGGNSAADFAIHLKPVADRVKIIHRRDRLTCDRHKIDLMKGVDVKLCTSILSIEKNHKVITDNGIFDTDYIIFCYGFKADPMQINGLRDLNINVKNNLINIYINTMSTGNNRIFAVGDAVTYENKQKNIVSCFFEADRAVRIIGAQVTQ
jgi:thioredoxin reductase (NADPH)